MPQPQIYGCRHAGKVALVAGAGTEGDGVGIGRAIAIVLGREGARVACLDIDMARAEDTASLLRDTGVEAFALDGNVSDGAVCRAAVERTVGHFGRLDILVNNVGISGAPSLAAIDEGYWTRVFDVNLKSVLLMCQAAVPTMIAGGGGSIVNISSIAGMRAYGSLAYGPSKAAMAQLSREITVLHGRDGIRANTVAPGHVMTPHAMHVLPPGLRETRRKVGPLGIEGDAWDVALAVSFLASDEARFIAGAHLAVDGGVTEIGPMVGHDFIMRDR